MTMAQNELSCPFCDFKDTDSYFLMQHCELLHPENGQSPFIADDEVMQPYRSSLEPIQEATNRFTAATSETNPRYEECPICSEFITSTETATHQDLHVAENIQNMELGEIGQSSDLELSTGACNDEEALSNICNSFTTDIPRSLRNYDQLQTGTKRVEKRRRMSLKDLILGSSSARSPLKASVGTPGKSRRLSRSELGPYAHEKQMPKWLQEMLEKGAKVTLYNTIGPDGMVVKVEAVANETPDLIPVLERLSHLDPSVERGYYCHPAVRHVSKMPREGGFCGYRNIQMMASYIRDAKAHGQEHFPGKLPSIIKLQDMIENAWDMGFNSEGKIETGGIRLTRKYIGTPEAQALLLSLDIPCDAIAFSTQGGVSAYENLLYYVADYFGADQDSEESRKVVVTEKPPLYFQHEGHSLTVVGIEIRTNSSANVVVFDPMFNPSQPIKKLIGSSSFRLQDPAKLMNAHRRGQSYLGKYRDFEVLQLTGPLPGSVKEI